MKKLIPFLVATSIAFSNLAIVQAKKEFKIFVDCKVTTSGDGSIDAPFKTLEEARDAIREMKKQGEYPDSGVTVLVRDGKYFLPNGFELSEEDSGVEGAPVTWTVYPGEHAKLIGGAEITFKDCEPVTDASIISRLAPEASGKVYQINLKEKGVDSYDALYCYGHANYYTRLYGLTDDEKELGVPEIFWDNGTDDIKIMNISQYPEKGEYMNIGKVVSAGDGMEKWYENEDPKKPDAPEPGVFKVDDERIRRWKDADQAWVYGFWKWDWSDQAMPIGKIDVNEKTIKPKIQSYYAITEGQRIFVYNLIEEMNTPGEWFLDKNTDILYFYPFDTNPESIMTLGFSSSNIISLNDAENIKIREFELSGTRANGISVKNCNNVSVSYLSVNKVSGDGIRVDGANNRVEGCHLYDLGGIGIDLAGGDRYNEEELIPANNIAFNNHIHNFSRLSQTYKAGIEFNGVGNVMKNNLIYDSVHLGVNPGGNDNIFEYNEIHSVVKTSSDMGAIYANVGMTQRGNVIRYNWIHDLKSSSAQVGGDDAVGGQHIYGVYLDNSSTGFEIYGNIFNDIDGKAVFINGGRDNTVKSNIIANTDVGVYINASARNTSWGWYQNWLNGERTFKLKEGPDNYGVPIVPHQSKAYSKYPHMIGILEGDPTLPEYNVMADNLAYNVKEGYQIDPMTGSGTNVTMEDMYKLSSIDECMVTSKDVGFKNAKEGDYSLKDDSEIYEKNPDFEKIDAERIGLVSSQLKGLLYKDSVALGIGRPNAYVNWERKVIDKDNIDVVPFIENNSTYVPLRFLGESFGAGVEWKEGKAYIDYNGIELIFTPNSNVALYDGSEIELSVPMIIRNSRIFVPLRAVSELFGKNVFWDDSGLVVVSGWNIEEKMTEDRVYDLLNRM